MPTFPDKEAAKGITRPAHKQPSPDPRMQPSASVLAKRAGGGWHAVRQAWRQRLMRACWRL